MKAYLRTTVAVCAVATGANAQEVQSFADDQIVVTAQKREQNLQDVPIAITAVSGEQLLNAGVDSVAALSELIPSVTFTQSTGDINSSVNIRGVGTSVFSSAVEPSVSFVVDGVVLARQGQAFQDLIDIERVEVLRGPQSTLFGKNASAGVVNVITQAPSEEFEFVGEALYAELDEVQLRATASGRVSDTVGARLTGFFSRRDGHIENVFDGRDLNGSERWGLRGKLQFDPSDALSVSVIADYSETDNNCCQYTARDLSTALNPGQGAAVEAALGPVVPGEENRQTNVGAPVFNDSEQWGLSVQADYDLGSHALTSITAYREWDFNNNIDVDGTPGDVATPGVLQLNVNAGDTGVRQFSQELRIASPAGERIDYVLGVYAFVLDLDRQFERRLSAFVPAFNTAIFQSGQFDGAVKTQNYSAFGNVNFLLTDRLTLNGGFRVIYEKLDYEVFRDPANTLEAGDFALGGGAGTFVDIDDSTDDFALAGKAGFTYALADNANAYFSYSRGYKGRAFDVAFTTTSSAEPIDAETSNALEAGVKAQFFDRRLTINTALFHTEFSNFQEQVAIPGELTAILINAGDVRTRGVEVEVAARPTEALTFSGGLTFTDAEITEFPLGPCFPGQTEAEGCVDGIQDLAGGSLPNAPDWRLNLTARYDAPLNFAPLNGFIQANYRWQDEVQFSLEQDPLTVQDAYGILNMSIGVRTPDNGVQATLFVRNLTDETYTANIFRDAVVTGAVSQYIPRDAERYFGGSVRLAF